MSFGFLAGDLRYSSQIVSIFVTGGGDRSDLSETGFRMIYEMLATSGLFFGRVKSRDCEDGKYRRYDCVLSVSHGRLLLAALACAAQYSRNFPKGSRGTHQNSYHRNASLRRI